MKKLLPIVLLLALGLFFNLDSFAQQGNQAKVANNNELIKALENPNVTSIVITQDGYYDAIDNSVFEGNVIVKSGNGRGASSCTLSITKTDECFVSGTTLNFATAGTSGDPTCPDQPTSGAYGWSVVTSAGSGTAAFVFTSVDPSSPMSDIYDYNAAFTVSTAGKYTLTYKWDAFNETTINVYIYDVPVITITNDTSSCEQMLFTYTYSFGYAAPETNVYWEVIDHNNDSVNVTPNSNPASEVTGATFNFDPTAFPSISTCGAYTLHVTSDNTTGCGTDDLYNFYIYDTPTGVNAGTDQSEVCEVGGAYSTSVSGSFDPVSCGNGSTPTVLWSSTSSEISFASATTDTTTVNSTACGTYTLKYTVTNGDCSFSDMVNVTFKALPTNVNAGADQDVCEAPTSGYVTTLNGSFTEALCGGSSTVLWTQISGTTVGIIGDTTLTPSIDATACGSYTFQMAVTNGTACSVFDTVVVNFYDLAKNVNAGSDQDVCEDLSGNYTTSLLGSYTDVSCGTTTIEWTYTTTGAGTLSFSDSTISNPDVTATTCGEYVLYYTIISGGASACSVYDSIIVNFYDLPKNVSAGSDKDVCDLTTTLSGTYDAVTCGTASVAWSELSGPGTATFDPVSADTANVGVTVDQCGEYVFKFAVVNADLCEVYDSIIVFFTDVPTFVESPSYPIPDSICGYTSNEFYLDYTASCMSSTNSGIWTALTGDATITETGGSGTNMWTATTGTGTCGDYVFVYTATNGVCSSTDTITITFFEAPNLTINTAGDVYTCSTVSYNVTNASCVISGEVVDYVWSVTGSSTISATTGTSVDVTWDNLDTIADTLFVAGTISGTDNGSCISKDTLIVTKILPTLEGQIKYWNAFETYMPTPFPTNLYGTYPEDYFYVTLYHINGTSLDSISTAYVQPRLMEDLSELMSYFDFDLNTTTYGCDAEYLIKVWDGGLVYHNNPPPPQNSPTYLGASYTYNEWGGVNATDAYAIQLMAAGSDLNTSYPWVGLHSDVPSYGYYSNNIADVNTSGTTITALDALIVNYRAVGLLGSYPNAGANQFSPNFAVTGRMVTALPQMTWPTYFDTTTNVEDIPFTHSGEEYMYFDDAINHKYTSEKIPWGDTANYINLYYEAEGDVNGSYIPTSAGFKAQPTIELNYENLIGTKVGEVITIPIRIDRDAALNAISLFLNYRNDLVEVIGTNYSEENTFVDQEKGILNIGWFSTDTRDVEEGEIIAQIQVRVLAEIPEGTKLFELTANTELADVTATPISDINLKTIGVTTDKVPFTGTELVANNYPNPFNSETTITYTLPESGKVVIKVLNNMGVVIRTLVEEVQEAGVQSFVYNTKADAGIYFYSITLQGETNNYSTVERMIVVN